MRRFAAAILLLALTATPGAQAQSVRLGESSIRRADPNPSAVIAAEMALTRNAREKGQWVALRESAAPDAVMLVPGLPLAQAWLKRQTEPATSARWQPYAVASSCDGTVMVVTGTWSAVDGRGEYASVWQRQEKGDYKWLIRASTSEADPPAEPDMLAARVADCALAVRPPRPPAIEKRKGQSPAVSLDPNGRDGRSRDGTLFWRVRLTPEGRREFSFDMAQDGQMKAVVTVRDASSLR